MTQNKKHFSHIFDFCFSVNSEDPDYENISAKEIRKAILDRVRMVNDDEILELCGLVDTDEYN